MKLVIDAFLMAKDTSIALADMAIGTDSGKRLDVTVMVMLLCLLGLVIYVMPLVALFILLYVSYCIIRPMIGETKDEVLNKYFVRDSWNK